MAPDLNLALKIAELVAGTEPELSNIDKKAEELAASFPEADVEQTDIAAVLRDEVRSPARRR